MNIFLSRVQKNINLQQNLYSYMSNIITTENNNIKFDNFKNIINFKPTDADEIFQHQFTRLLLYSFNIHRDFKNDLLIALKDKASKELTFKVLDNFLNTLEYDKTDTNNIEFIRLKLRVFNIYYEVASGNSDYIGTNGFIHSVEFHINNLLKDLQTHLLNVNEDVYLLLNAFLKAFVEFFRNNYPHKNIFKDNTFDMLSDILNTHEAYIVQFNKDFEFLLSYSYFLFLSQTHTFEEYKHNGLSLLAKYTDKPFYLLYFLKAFLINIKNSLLHDYILNNKLGLFNNLLSKYLINKVDIPETMTIFELYTIFLENDFKVNFTNIFNDIFLMCVQKIDKFENQDKINKNFIQNIFEKMRRDKVDFCIMDDNYFYVVELLCKSADFVVKEISEVSFNYLNKLITNKERLMLIEAKLFKFLDFKQKEHLDLMKQYFNFIFSKKFDKKNLTLINDYTKTMCDYYFDFNSDSFKSLQPQDLFNKYTEFLEIFTPSFFDYLVKIDSKDLKLLSNLFVNIEKYNKNLYALIVNKFHEKYIITKPVNLDYCSVFAIFITLMKPFKDHKKSVTVDTHNIYFKLTIIEKLLDINITITIKELKQLVKSIDRYLVTYILDFIVGIEEPEKVFPIILKLLKYNVKTSFVEYKTSLMKMLVHYFNDYVTRLAKMLNKVKNSPKEASFIETSVKNFTDFFEFLSNNIFDRPAENLLIYIDILKLNLELFNQIRDAKNKEVSKRFEDILQRFIYNKDFAFSLISLLIKSWYFIKNGCFEMLKDKQFTPVLEEVKDILLTEIDTYYGSLRQMDSEGSILIFNLMLHHFGEDFLKTYFERKDFNLFHHLSDKSELNTNVRVLDIFYNFLKERKDGYFEYLKSDNNTNDKTISIHYLFVFIKTLLENEKNSNVLIPENQIILYSSKLLDLTELIYDINKTFKKHLLNNGVSEFTTEGDQNDFITDSEDKRLISLWCSTKYSIECLDLIFDIIDNNYRILSSNSALSTILKYLEGFLIINIDLMIDSQHMGAVRLFNDILLKVAKLVNNNY
jgi:hypothetical protein